MPKRLSYANVTATLALFFAMSGGALAAKHYLLNSTRQINPKVLKALKGRTGASGATGATGKEGARGKEGAEGKEGREGKEGPLVKTLPHGQTLTGGFSGTATLSKEPSVSSSTPVAEASISFPFSLVTNPKVEVIQESAAPTEHCPGSHTSPSAASGYLCVYVRGGNGVNAKEVEFFGDSESGDYRYGVTAFAPLNCTAPCFGEFWGSWAVTAP